MQRTETPAERTTGATNPTAAVVNPPRRGHPSGGGFLATISPALGWPNLVLIGMISDTKEHHRVRIVEAVLFVFFLLAFALVAQPHVVAVTATGLLIASLIVQPTARALSGVKVSLAAAFRTLVLTFLLSMLAAFTVMSLLIGARPEFVSTLTNLGANALAFGAYVLGFRVGLGLNWGHAAIVAAMSSLIIGACVWLAVSQASLAVN